MALCHHHHHQSICICAIFCQTWASNAFTMHFLMFSFTLLYGFWQDLFHLVFVTSENIYFSIDFLFLFLSFDLRHSLFMLFCIEVLWRLKTARDRSSFRFFFCFKHQIRSFRKCLNNKRLRVEWSSDFLLYVSEFQETLFCIYQHWAQVRVPEKFLFSFQIWLKKKILFITFLRPFTITKSP